ncbi:Protein Niban 2 [Manis pentadactyla]|nr:Protein Niban 2 [Manis pentadactyla]
MRATWAGHCRHGPGGLGTSPSPRPAAETSRPSPRKDTREALMPHRALDLITTHPRALDTQSQDRGFSLGDLCCMKSLPP